MLAVQDRVTLNDNRDIKRMVDDIWDKFDVNRSGHLDKDELKDFLKEGIRKYKNFRLDKFNPQTFDDTFKKFDKNKNGQIEQNEMVEFIKEMINQ